MPSFWLCLLLIEQVHTLSLSFSLSLRLKNLTMLSVRIPASRQFDDVGNTIFSASGIKLFYVKLWYCSIKHGGKS